LHLIEHCRERSFQLESLLDFVGAHVGIFALFEKARTLVAAKELHDRRCVHGAIVLRDRIRDKDKLTVKPTLKRWS
jgi:hypothetical protein